LKFRRQHPLENYIVDFYCHEHLLAIELDGNSHEGRAAQDTERTRQLNERGIRMLRISNDDVLRDLDGVLELILRACGAEEQ
jgi:very-short-patch-repair endonuclease